MELRCRSEATYYSGTRMQLLAVGFDVTSSPRHVLRAQQFDQAFLQRLFARSDQIRQSLSLPHSKRIAIRSQLSGYTLFNLFYEPSTRTRISFSAAAAHLGMAVVSTENAREFSSAAKGETLEDSIRVLGEYLPDVIVLRHFETGAAERAAAVSPVPIINAGDGAGQHPTQALLDLYTIVREQGSLEGLTVTMGGDLAHGRTVRSLAYLLSKYPVEKLIFVAPAELQIGQDILDHLDEHSVAWEQHDDPRQALPDSDVIYWTRLQKERLEDQAVAEQLGESFRITHDTLRTLRPSVSVLHPLPRVGEIATEVDADPRAAYFRQTGNGMYLRAALLEWVTGHGA